MGWEPVALPAVGSLILADNLGSSGYAQGLKMVDPTDGSSTPWVVSVGGQASLPVALIGASGAAQTLADSLDILPTAPTIDSTAYGQYEVLSAPFIFEDAASIALGSGWTTYLRVCDKIANPVNLEFWFFRSEPNSSVPAKNATFNLSWTDLQKVVGVVSTAAGTWWDAGTGGKICVVPVAPPMPYKMASGADLWCMVKTLASHTWTNGTGDLVFSMFSMRD